MDNSRFMIMIILVRDTNQNKLLTNKRWLVYETNPECSEFRLMKFAKARIQAMTTWGSCQCVD